MGITPLLEAASAKRVLFVGERIEDIYHYGRILGKSSKEPILVFQPERSESFSGGVSAAAEHARSFCASVQIASSVVLQKHRYIDPSHTRKLFEIQTDTVHLDNIAFGELASYDAVIVTDYGHGMMTPSLISRLCNEAQFLAVNVQTNAGNYGFNLATKYPRADYLCVDQMEARLATQNQDGELSRSLIALSAIAPRVVITIGRDGAIGMHDKNVCRMPAFTDRVTDTMGAGDAFFALTALVADIADMDDLLRIGNAAGAMKAQTVGHKTPITKHVLRAYLASQTR